MAFLFKSTLVLAMATTIIGHPLQLRNTQAGNSNEHLNKRNPTDIPIAAIVSLIGGNTKAGAYDEDIAAADPTKVLGKRTDIPIAAIVSLIGGNKQAGAYDEDIAAADPAKVLGKRTDIPIAAIVSLIGGNKQAGAYDEDVAAADPAEVLGKRAKDIPIIAIE